MKYTLLVSNGGGMKPLTTGSYQHVQFFIDDLPNGTPLIVEDENKNEVTRMFDLSL